MIDFSLQNSTFVKNMYPKIPRFLQKKLVEQVRNSIAHDREPAHRMIATYRALREIQPGLTPIEGTDPGIYTTSNGGFSKLLYQSNQGLSKFLDVALSSADNSFDDAIVLDFGWKGISRVDLGEFKCLQAVA
jgi:hypothetical protein